MNARNISYFKDKKYLGIAFSNIKLEEACPIFTLKQTGTKATLMPESYSMGGLPPDYHLNRLIDLSQVMLCLAKDRVPPRAFLRRAYNNWRLWLKQTVQMHQTIAGFDVELNVSDSKLAPWKFKHGDRVSSPEGEKIIVGVHGERLWHRSLTDNKVWFWSKQYVEEWTAEIQVLEKSAWKPEPCVVQEMPFHKFEEYACSTTHEEDLTIVKAFNKSAALRDIRPSNLSVMEIVRAVGTNNPRLTPEIISVRGAFLRELNDGADELMTFVAFEEHKDEWTIGGLINRMCDLFFLHTKETAYEWLIAHTTQLTHLRDDEYTDPSNLMSIAVNREKAQRYSEDPDADKRKRASLFYQVYERLRGMGVGRKGAGGATANLRQRYTGILDAGQSRTFKITFQNEGVTDNGGPYRELFSHFCKELQSDVLALLVECPNARAQIGNHQEAFVFNARLKSKSDLDLFHFMGQMIGVAWRSQIPLELRFPRFVWKRLTGMPVLDEDIRAVDENLFNMLDDMLAIKNAEDFALKFPDVSFCIHTYDGEEQVELMTNGAEVPVTFENREAYVEKVKEFKLSEGVLQMDEMMAGLATIIPTAELCIFTPDELEVKVCGAPTVDINILKQNVVYDGIDEKCDQVEWLWELLEEMDQEQRALFLQFTWARSRMPVASSQMTMKFKVQGAPSSVNQKPDDHLPLAHTCFFSLALPEYSSKAILKSKLFYAMQHCRAMDSDFRLHNSELHMTRSL